MINGPAFEELVCLLEMECPSWARGALTSIKAKLIELGYQNDPRVEEELKKYQRVLAKCLK